MKTLISILIAIFIISGCMSTSPQRYIPKTVRITCPAQRVLERCQKLRELDRAQLNLPDYVLRELAETRLDLAECYQIDVQWNELYDQCPRVEVVEELDALDQLLQSE